MNKTMNDLIRIPANTQHGDDVEMTDEPATIHIGGYYGGTPGLKTKVRIDLPSPREDGGKAKDTLKLLAYDRTARTFDPRTKKWEANMDALNLVVTHMMEEGYDVTVDLSVAKVFENSRGGRTFLPELR